MHRFPESSCVPSLIDVLALACGLRGRVPVDACDSCGSAMPALRRAPQVLVPGGDTEQPCMCRYQCAGAAWYLAVRCVSCHWLCQVPFAGLGGAQSAPSKWWPALPLVKTRVAGWARPSSHVCLDLTQLFPALHCDDDRGALHPFAGGCLRASSSDLPRLGDTGCFARTPRTLASGGRATRLAVSWLYLRGSYVHRAALHLPVHWRVPCSVVDHLPQLALSCRWCWACRAAGCFRGRLRLASDV